LLGCAILISCLLVYLALLAMLSKPSLNELYLMAASYVVMVTFVALTLLMALTPHNSITASMTLVFLTFAMLPVHLYEALLAALLLALTHLLVVAFLLDDHLTTQKVRTHFYYFKIQLSLPKI
jgi:hypothetical protein